MIKRMSRMLVAACLLAPLACHDLWINTVAPLGGDVAGGRGLVEVVFANETPYRAIFTFGIYDPQNQNSVPQFGQFAVDPQQDETAFNRGLAADTVTQRGSVLFNCGRVLSLGGQEMLDRIREAEASPFNNAPLIEAAMRTGIYFTSAPLDDPDANGVERYDVRADPVNSLVGVNFSCDSLLIYTLELDPEDAGRVRIRLDAVPAVDE